MKVLLDTNVLIASLIARGVCTDLGEHCVVSHAIAASEFVLEELRSQLVDKFNYSQQDADEAAALFGSQMEMVTPQPLNQPVCRDPDDDNILAAAVAAQADCIVTGDKDLLVLQQFEGIRVLSPSDFSDFEAEDKTNDA